MNFRVIFVAAGTILLIIRCISEVTCKERSVVCNYESLRNCRCSEIQATFSVDCSNTGLNSVPKELPSRTTHLYLNNNKIQVLYNDSFVQSKGRLPNLITVSIRSNPLTKIEINAFRGLVSLKILDLYNNSLQFQDSYPKSVFVPINESLEVLDIRRNLLGDINKMNYQVSVGELDALKKLRIDCLGNKSLPMEYGKLKNLTKLSFSGGRKEIHLVSDDMFKAVSALSIMDVDFAGLGIAIIGNNTFLDLPRLKILDLSNNEAVGNHIVNIIPALKKTSIESLMLNNTGIGQEKVLTPLAKKLGELHLKKLTLDNNTINYLKPKCVKYFTKLKVLSVGNNFVFNSLTLKHSFMSMKQLTGLNVSWQQKFSEQANVMRLPPKSKLLNGTSLQGVGNNICDPGMACLWNFPPNIQWVDLSHSNYESSRPPEFVLLQNSSLKSLDLSYNGIHFIEKPIFCVKSNTSSVVPQIETINYNNNALQCITSEYLSHCDWSSLKRVFVRNNKLGQTEKNICNRDKNNILGAGKHAINLEVLDLARNQIQNGTLLSDIGLFIKLKELDLSFNGFQDFSVVLQNMTELRRLNLSNNNIGCLSLSTTLDLNKLQHLKPKTEKIEVDLSGNLLSCSCECLDFFQWMMRTEVTLTDMDNYQCKFNDGRRESLYELDFIVAKLESQCFGDQWLNMCLSLEVVIYLLITVACVSYRRRYDIKYIFLKMKLNRHKLRKILDTRNYTYSAFISCDHRDAKYFVYRKFLPNLETHETKLKFCVAQRNFLVGATILDNIMRAINKSRKVIFIVSQYFLTSKWCQEELMIAHQVSSVKLKTNIHKYLRDI